MLMALTFVLVIVAIFSDTSIGRTLRDALSGFRVPRPTRGQWAAVVLLTAIMAGLVAVLRTDGLAIGARALPDGIAWFAAFDGATWLDVTMLAAVTALTLRLRVIWAFIRSAGAWVSRAVQAVRRRWSMRAPRASRAKAPASNDDDRRWAGAAFA